MVKELSAVKEEQTIYIRIHHLGHCNVLPDSHWTTLVNTMTVLTAIPANDGVLSNNIDIIKYSTPTEKKTTSSLAAAQSNQFKCTLPYFGLMANA